MIDHGIPLELKRLRQHGHPLIQTHRLMAQRQPLLRGGREQLQRLAQAFLELTQALLEADAHRALLLHHLAQLLLASEAAFQAGEAVFRAPQRGLQRRQAAADLFDRGHEVRHHSIGPRLFLALGPCRLDERGDTPLDTLDAQIHDAPDAIELGQLVAAASPALALARDSLFELVDPRADGFESEGVVTVLIVGALMQVDRRAQLVDFAAQVLLAGAHLTQLHAQALHLPIRRLFSQGRFAGHAASPPSRSRCRSPRPRPRR